LNFEFEWFNKELGANTVTVAEYGLLFNRAATETLGRPEMVLLGFDKNNLVIGIKPITQDHPEASSGFVYIERERSGQVRINSKDFIRSIKQYWSVASLNPAKRYTGVWDETSSIMYVDIKRSIGDDEDCGSEYTPSESE
jgi:hypothetical protein